MYFIHLYICLLKRRNKNVCKKTIILIVSSLLCTEFYFHLISYLSISNQPLPKPTVYFQNGELGGGPETLSSQDPNQERLQAFTVGPAMNPTPLPKFYHKNMVPETTIYWKLIVSKKMRNTTCFTVIFLC